MSVISRFLAKKDDAPSKDNSVKGRGQIYIMQDKPLSPFEKWDRDAKTLAIWKNIYRTGGIVSQGIDAYSSYILSNGYRLEGDEALVKKVNEKLLEINLDNIIESGIKDALIYGRCFQEIAYGSGSMAGEPMAVIPLPGDTLRLNLDPMGNINSYTQLVGKPSIIGQQKVIQFPVENVLSFSLIDLPGEAYGISLVGRSIDEIMNDAKISQATATAIIRHGFPRYHIRMGRSGEPITAEDMRGVDMEFRTLEPKNEITTPFDVEIKNIDEDALPDIEKISNWVTGRVLTAIGVPEIILGISGKSTEASAKVAMNAFYDRISFFQKKIARNINMGLIDKITGRKGAVKLYFNDANPTDESVKAEWVCRFLNATPADPFAVIPRDYILDVMGIDKNMYPVADIEVFKGQLDRQMPLKSPDNLPKNSNPKQGIADKVKAEQAEAESK